jgi:type IV pilus assembly protein PilM
MSFFPKQPLIVGVENTPTSLKLAFLKKRGKGWDVTRTVEISHEDACQVLDIIPDSALIVSALPEAQVLVRPLELPLKKEKDIDKAFEFQAENLLPYPLEKAILQKSVASKKPESTLLTVFAVKKEHLNEHLSRLREQKIESEIVTSPSCALKALCSHLGEQNQPTLIMHLGEQEGVVILIENDELLASRSFENDKYEMQKSVLSILTSNKSKKIDTIYLFASQEIAARIVKEATGKNVELPDLEKDHPGFSLAIGIALSATKGSFPNFRRKEFTYPYQWKKVKKPLLTYFSAAALVLVALFSLEKNVLTRSEKRLLERGSYLVEKTPSKEELLDKLQSLSKELEHTPNTFALLPILPSVSELMASFCKDSAFINSEKEPLVNIDEFQYTLVSRPSFESRAAHYQVKVDILLSSANPKIAQAFYEYLKTNHPFVDQQKEVTWDIEKGKYRSSFYLKDKTRYHN